MAGRAGALPRARILLESAAADGAERSKDRHRRAARLAVSPFPRKSGRLHGVPDALSQSPVDDKLEHPADVPGGLEVFLTNNDFDARVILGSVTRLPPMRTPKDKLIPSSCLGKPGQPFSCST